MTWRLAGGWLGLCFLAVFAAGCASGTGGDQNTNDNSNDNGNDNVEVEPGVEIEIPNEGNLHVSVGQQVTYQANPPASGSHWSAAGIAPVEAGVHETPLEEEQWV